MNTKSISKLFLSLFLAAPLLLQVNCGGGGGGGGGGVTTSVSGKVVAVDGRGLPDVSLQVTGRASNIYGCTEAVTQSTQTDDNGSYQFSTQESGVTSGNVSIKPEAFYYTFEPAIANVSLNYGEHAEGLNFTGYQLFDLSGTISNPLNADLTGITITADNGTLQVSSQVSPTGSFNLYRLKEGHHTIRASSPYFTFIPLEHQISSAGEDVANVIFQATPNLHQISGRIDGADLNNNLAGISVVLSGIASAETTTDLNGEYLFSDLIRGEYHVTPKLPGYYFYPESQAVAVDLLDNPDVDFVANYTNLTLSGQIVDEGGTAQPGITVNIDGPVTASTTTNESGDYSIPGLLLGNYTLTPVINCASFDMDPINRFVTLNDTDLIGQDFTANRNDFGPYVISGKALDKDGLALINQPILLGETATDSTTTDSFGDYQFTGLTTGPYTIEAGASSFNLGPLRYEIDLCSADAGELDFREIATWNRYGYLRSTGVAAHKTSAEDHVVALKAWYGATEIGAIKVNAYGDPIWLKAYSGAQNEIATSITATASGGSVIAGIRGYPGTNYTEGLILRVDSVGSLLWANSYTDIESLTINSVLETIDDGYLAAGSLTMAGATTAGVVFKVNENGNLLWQHEFPTLALQHALSTVGGGYAVVGDNVFIKITDAGTLSWAKSYAFGDWQASFDRVLAPSTNGYFLVGNITDVTATPTDKDHLAIKIDQDGNLIWGKRIGTVATSSAEGELFADAGISSANGLFITGTRQGSGSIIYELDSDGVTLWHKSPGTAQKILSLSPADSGRFLGAGYYSWSSTGYTLRLTKVDSGEDTCTRYDKTNPWISNLLAGVANDYSLTSATPGQLITAPVSLSVTEQAVTNTLDGTCLGL